MKVLITGNMGYVGPCVLKLLRARYPSAYIIGYDMGYFASQLTNADNLPECNLDVQYIGDIRHFPEALLTGIDTVIHLAAISNDPMGNAFENVTYEINHRASAIFARAAKKAGVRSFVFASSCSIYGSAGSGARTENSPVNPLTAYAKSKVLLENELKNLADKDFLTTCLRFSTACGMSDRLRLDLVLNDFVASAIVSNQIMILSDGTSWRPLIHIRDMARAIDWALSRDKSSGEHLVVNVGTNSWNYQIKDLAEVIAGIIPDVQVNINKHAQPDKRSYKVNFDLFSSLAPDYLPQYDLPTVVEELKAGLDAMNFNDKLFRSSRFMRLKVLEHLKDKGLLKDDLRWAFK